MNSKEDSLEARHYAVELVEFFFKAITLYCRISTWISLKVLIPALKQKDPIKRGDCCLQIFVLALNWKVCYSILLSIVLEL